jgi:hypothetical protein
VAIENLVDHGDHPFLSLSERERVSVDAVIGCAKRLLDQLQSGSFAEPVPGPYGRARPDKLRNRSIFAGRTGAEAISHGDVSFLLKVAGEAGCEGRDQSSPAT